MTADSLPSRTAELLGVGPRTAADAEASSDPIGGAPPAGRASTGGGRARIDLDDVERAFGRHFFDQRARASVETARARASSLATAAGEASPSLALAYASDLFVSLAVERPWRSGDTRKLVPALANALGMRTESLALQLLVGSLRAPQLLELPPLVALEVQLAMLPTLTPAVEVSLWTKDSTGRIQCLLAIGRTATTRRFRAVALSALDGTGADSGARGTIIGVPVRRWVHPWAALVARMSGHEAGTVFLEEAAAAMTPVVEREFLLQRNAARERSLVSASEKRLGRLGFDLHDGALQQIAALGAEIRVVRRDVRATVPEPICGQVVSRIDVLEAGVGELDRVLRELAHSLEPASLLRRPLPRVIDSELAAFTERTGIDARARVTGDFGAMTTSQKIALIRVVQEALANIREHSNAAAVQLTIAAMRDRVDVRIEDDGDGFDVARTLLDAAKRGRLGLVGSSERVRLLGGTFDVRSRAGGPTMVSVSLPRWQPLGAERPEEGPAIPALVVE